MPDDKEKVGRGAVETEQKLRERGRFLEAVFDSVQDGISVLGADLTIRQVNGVMKQWYARKAPLEGKKCYACYYGADRPCDPCPTLRCLQTGSVEREIVPGLAGSRVEWIELYSYLMRDAETGEIIGVVEFVRDITERKRSEQELHRLRGLLANIVDSMPSVLIGVDGEGRVTQWNREAERSTGLAAAAALGRQLPEAAPELAPVMDRVGEAVREGEPVREEKLPFQLGGQARLTDLTVYPLLSNGSVGAVIRLDDVTERVRVEDMMAQSERMLSVGGLAAGIAHEINNPLAGVLQGLEVAQRRLARGQPENARLAIECGTGPEAVEAYLEKRGIYLLIETARDSARRLVEVVDNVLSFSRPAAGRFEPADLTELLDRSLEQVSVESELNGQPGLRTIEILREYQPDMTRVLCEPGKMRQVFVNILRNGVQAMAQGIAEGAKKPRFTLRVLPEGELARIEIEDNGPGMPEEVRRRIFELFFTARGSGKGTGLGLAVAYFIVTDNQGGTLAAESIPGRGTRFVIRLPTQGGGAHTAGRRTSGR